MDAREKLQAAGYTIEEVESADRGHAALNRKRSQLIVFVPPELDAVERETHRTDAMRWALDAIASR